MSELIFALGSLSGDFGTKKWYDTKLVRIVVNISCCQTIGMMSTRTRRGQEIVRLRFGQDLSCSEIATALRKQENVVRVTLSRSLIQYSFYIA